MALEFELLLHMLARRNRTLHKGDQIVTTAIRRGILMGQAGHCHDKRATSEQERRSPGSSTSSCAALTIITHYSDLHIDVTFFQKHRGLCSSIDVLNQHHRPMSRKCHSVNQCRIVNKKQSWGYLERRYLGNANSSLFGVKKISCGRRRG